MRGRARGEGRGGTGASCEAFGYRWCIVEEWASVHPGTPRHMRHVACAGTGMCWAAHACLVVHVGIPVTMFTEGLKP